MFKKLTPAFLLIAAVAGLYGFASAQTAFNGTGLGAIPDATDTTGCQYPGAPLNVTFNVSGFPTAPSSISVEMAFNPSHGWGGDIVATLISPDNTEFVVFGYTGISSGQGTWDGGDGSDLVGPYVFSDTASGNWWNAANSTDDALPIPPGSYRTSSIGGLDANGAVTSMNAAFAAIPTSNGVWTLRFTDGCNTDSAAVSAAKLTLSADQAAVFQKPNVDMNGLGRSDFVVLREEFVTSPAAKEGSTRTRSVRDRLRRDLDRKRSGFTASAVDPSYQWWTLFSESPSYSVAALGNAFTDWQTPADFDGDNVVDIAVWRPGNPDESAFYWIKSTDSTLGSSLLGVIGDDPAVVGDYDGDNRADPAVFRCPEAGGQCYFFYRGTNNNPAGNITYWPLGYGTPFDVLAYPGDFDGDQRYDFCVFRPRPDLPDQGQFVFQVSSNLNSVEYAEYGLTGIDYLVPGDYDADGKTDFAIARPENGHWNYYVLERDGGGNPASPVQFGLWTDDLVPGDYDGDGRADFAIYRPGEVGQNSAFWVLRSSDGQVFVQPFGLGSDIPAAEWIVH